MDCQSSNIFDIWKEFAVLTVDGVEEIKKNLEEQTLKLDVVFNELLQSVQKDSFNYVPEKKMSKRQSKTKNGSAIESNFQQPAIPPLRKTRRQASIVAMDKIKGVRESATISSGLPGTARASRIRALSTCVDLASMDGPKGNSTFVVDNKSVKNIDECLSPQMFSPENMTYIMPSNPNQTYDMPTKSTTVNVTKCMGKNLNIIPEDSPISEKDSNSVTHKSSTKRGIKKNCEEPLVKNKRREKLEDIDVNIAEQSQHMTRTMKRKLLEENQIEAKKTNVIHVPLEKQISTPLKPLEEISSLTPHLIRENEAEKRKERYLKSKANQKKFDDQTLKAAKQREEHMKRVEEKIKKAAEEKKIKEEKQKLKEITMKEEMLKKHKLAELRLAEINAKRKQADEAKLLKLQKAEMERKLKESELKKKMELIKQEKSKSIRPKATTSTIPTPSVSKIQTVPKIKAETVEVNKNDYGLHDVSARDSSEDESGPRKPVPDWAKRENRKAVLELQYHVDSKERDMFFDCPKSMSLKEMFKGWNIRDRQRTSSAVWNTPPRYSEYIRRQ